MKSITLNKVGVGSFAKVVGITQAVFGFIYGLILTVSVASESITSDTPFVKALGVSVFTLGMSIILLPLIFFVIGWVQGAVMALILNFVFKESKGLDLEIEDKK
jgi:hypothetical protein